MVTFESVNLDALVGRYLLPSAPDDLVREVRKHLEDTDLHEMPARSSRTERAGNGDRSGPLPERSPWQVLHVASSAPPGVVEVAYQFWRRSHAPALDVRTPDAPAVPPPAPWADDQPGAVDHQPRVDADDRLSALGVGVGGAPLAERSCSLSAAAFIESVSGRHRFGIGGRPLRIGLDPGCDVRVPEGGANVDARIWLHGDRYLLHVAAGGVLVNGASASWAVLDDGDILEIGNATFRFRREDV